MGLDELVEVEEVPPIANNNIELHESNYEKDGRDTDPAISWIQG